MSSSNESENNDNDSYPIHEAVLEGDCDKILSLLEQGYNINYLNDSYETPVHVAVFHKQYDILKLLLSNDAQPIIEGYSNPLLHATSQADQECIEILLDYKSDPSYQDELIDNFWTPLHEACHKGLTLILEKFIETTCDLDVRNEEGATPVYISCQYGQRNCLQLLLNHGANAEIAVHSLDTPLDIACQEGYYDCVATLLNHGVNIDTNRSALTASCYDDQYECAKLLIENGVSLHSHDMIPPIYVAARHSSVLCLGLLIENGVDVNSDCMGFTPLYEAVSAQNLPGCKMLLSKGADPSCICEYNMLRKTPLMVAASNNDVEIIKELVSHGADVNQTTFTSPLLLAAKFKCCEALGQLLSYNPDINYVDEGGNSALSMLCTALVINYSTDEYNDLLQYCRKILISGADITHFTKVRTISTTMQDTLLVRMCPDLIRLLLEFATCREHVQFLSAICEKCIEEGLEDWQQLYDLIWQPRKLTHLCRIKIRCVLGEKGLKYIEELPLPSTLKGYLRHNEGITFQ